MHESFADSRGKEVLSIKRLDGLDASRLIPANLQIDEIEGEPKILVKKEPGQIDFVIIDENKVPFRHAQDFKYVEIVEDKINAYPELKAGKDLYYRPLILGHISEVSPTILYGDMAETNPALRGKGFGLAFFENLYMVAEQLGYKFFAGHHNDAETAQFFLNRGHFLIEEISNEFRAEIDVLREQASDSLVYSTVKILKPEDIELYIRPERIGASVEDRIEYKEKFIALYEIFERLINTIQKIKTKTEGDGDRATIIEVLEDLNNLLPEQDRYSLGLPSEDDDNFVELAESFLDHLKDKSPSLAQNATLEDIEENLIDQ